MMDMEMYEELVTEEASKVFEIYVSRLDELMEIKTEEAFGAYISMLIDSWCACHEYDAIEFKKDILEMGRFMNLTMGSMKESDVMTMRHREEVKR